MIGLKTDRTLILVVTFTVLLIYFFCLIKKDSVECSFEYPCIRFCSRHEKSDFDLLEKFEDRDSLSSRYDRHRNLSDYNVIRGQPECIDEKNYSTDNYKFTVRHKFHFLQN